MSQDNNNSFATASRSVGTDESNIGSLNSATTVSDRKTLSTGKDIMQYGAVPNGLPNFTASLSSMDILGKSNPPWSTTSNSNISNASNPISYLPGSSVWQTYGGLLHQDQQRSPSVTTSSRMQKAASDTLHTSHQYSYSDPANMDSLMNHLLQMNASDRSSGLSPKNPYERPEASNYQRNDNSNYQRQESTNHQRDNSATFQKNWSPNQQHSTYQSTSQYNSVPATSASTVSSMYAQSQGPLSMAGTAISSGASDQSDFQIKLQLKDAVIVKLQEELDKSRKRAQAVVSAVNETDKLGFEIPKNHEELYRKLVEKLQSTEKELEDTKNRLEALVTAIALNPSQSQYKYGRYDEQEIAHKIITKLQMLSEENEELSKLLSYGKAKEKDIEIGLLRSQNLELRDKLAKFESKGEPPSTKLITSK